MPERWVDAGITREGVEVGAEGHREVGCADLGFDRDLETNGKEPGTPSRKYWRINRR